MTEPANIEQRKPIWIALSEFYLDTELQESDFREIAFKIIESPYTFDEVKKINKYEVFPVLQVNLLSFAGEWAGFDEDWLVGEIITLREKKSLVRHLITVVTYQMFKWMCKNYWKKLFSMYNYLKTNPESFILSCRTAFFNEVFPFQFDKRQNPIYQKLEQISIEYKIKGKLREYYEHLLEGQYYINIWTAFFLLEIFDLTGEEKLIGLKDDQSVFQCCYKLIEDNFQSFKDKEQIKNCSFWLEKRKAAYNKRFGNIGA